MFIRVHFKLSLLYSFFFFIIFWTFSFGIYTWMEHSFGANYIGQIRQQQTERGSLDSDFDDQKRIIVTIAGVVALNQLKNIILILNGLFIFVIPAVSWYLTKKSLSPINIAHEKQKQFASDASHELRTPLAIMLGEVEIALQKSRSEKYYQQILTSTKEELNRLSTLVDNLLFLARADQNYHDIQFGSVDCIDVLSSVIANLRTEIKRKNLHIIFLPPQSNLLVAGNESLLHQLFFNLLENAVKYTPFKGVITVSVVRNNAVVEIAITDTGIGISSANKDKIFERFYRADSSRSLNKGYGLGLSICHVIVKRHRGTLHVNSIENKGSTFIVALPLASLPSSS